MDVNRCHKYNEDIKTLATDASTKMEGASSDDGMAVAVHNVSRLAIETRHIAAHAHYRFTDVFFVSESQRCLND
jgi:hypothetical protein